MKGQTYKRCVCPPEQLRDAQGRQTACHRKHGTWYFRHDAPAVPSGVRREVRRGGFATEREARRAMTESLASLARGVFVDRNRLSLTDYLEEWLHGRVNLRPASVVFYRVAVELYLKPELGRISLVDLRANDIEGALRRIAAGTDGRGNPPSAALLARLKTTLRAALNVAVKRGLLYDNPAVHVEVPSHVRPRVQVWDANTTGRFLDATGSSVHGPLWHLIASFGLRRGEAAGLRWQDVDLDAGTVTISVQRTQIGRDIVTASPKTKAGSRRLSLDAGTVAVLREQERRQHRVRALLGSGWPDSGLVFTMEDGRPIQPQYITRLFARACKDGAFPAIRLHDLRHTSASLGLAAGETLVEVSRRLGHSQLAITADTYTHVLPAVAKTSSEARAALLRRTVVMPSAEAAATKINDYAPTMRPTNIADLADAEIESDITAAQRPSLDAPPSGLEPETLRLTVACSAN